MDALAQWIARRAGSVLIAVVVLTLGALHQIVDLRTGALRLEIDPSIDRLLPESGADRADYDFVRRLFGSDESVLIAIVTDDIFRAERLLSVVRMTRRLAAVPGVHHVRSLANALDFQSSGPDGADLSMRPLLEDVPTDAASLAELRRAALGNPLYAGTLVSENGRATTLQVHLRDLSERELVAMGTVATVERIAREEAGDAEVRITGGLYAKTESARLLLEDLARTLPLAVGVAMAVAWVSFRSLPGLLLPAATSALGVVWTLGFVSAIGVALNLVTVIVPTLLLCVGFAYSIHVVSGFEERRGASDRGDAALDVYQTLRAVGLAVILTGVTTAAGLLSLVASSIVAIRQFGAFSALGIGFSVLASLTFTPAVLALLPMRTRGRRRSADLAERVGVLSDRLAGFDVRNRNVILLAGGALFVLSLVGALQIRVSSSFLEPGSELARSAQVLGEHFDGANGFLVVVESESDGAFREPAILEELRTLQGWLEAQPEVGGATSLVDPLMLLYRAFRGDPEAPLELPRDRTLVSQLVFFAAGDDLEQYVDSRFRRAVIRVGFTLRDSAQMAALIERIEERARHLPGGLSARVTGNTVLVTRAMDDIARGQALSLSVAFAMILTILSLLFTSVRVGLLALIPNALPVAVYFGILGFSGVTLNATTGLVACIVLGIAVDDTIHFLSRFNSAAKRMADETKGIGAALRGVGLPVTVTTAALCGGFLVLTTSQFQGQVQFGALSAATLAVAWAVDLTFTPALASRMHIVSLWDALTFDLGADPHRSIPFFHGLRKTQARITALMTRVTRFPEGHQLFSAGEEGNEMYVVIDGELSASIDTESGRVQFGILKRGDVVGEVALFHGTRTADVRVESDVRLLRLTRDTLERIRRRYPRTGAQLYANLSEILAERVATTTERVR